MSHWAWFELLKPMPIPSDPFPFKKKATPNSATPYDQAFKHLGEGGNPISTTAGRVNDSCSSLVTSAHFKTVSL